MITCLLKAAEAREGAVAQKEMAVERNRKGVRHAIAAED